MYMLVGFDLHHNVLYTYIWGAMHEAFSLFITNLHCLYRIRTRAYKR